MKQQVNLYVGESGAERQRFDARTVLLGLAGVVLLLALYSAMQYWDLRRAQLRVEAATAALSAMTQQLAARAGGSGSEDMDQVARLEHALTEKVRLRDTLVTHLAEPAGGYSGYLVALARQHVSGLWLTEVTVAGAGRQLGFAGLSTDPALVPDYLQRLAREPSLDGASFSAFKLSRLGSDEQVAGARVRFQVATDRQELQR